jgi:hypothetical protein
MMLQTRLEALRFCAMAAIQPLREQKGRPVSNRGDNQDDADRNGHAAGDHP